MIAHGLSSHGRSARGRSAQALRGPLSVVALVVSMSWADAASAAEPAQVEDQQPTPALGSPASSSAAWSASALVHARSYTLLGYSPAGRGLPSQQPALAVQRLRPDVRLGLGHAARVEASWEIVALVGSDSLGLSQLVTQRVGRQRLADLDGSLFEASGGAWALRHNLDRLLVRVGDPGLELTLGRQAISHGSARILPAADLFGPFGPGTIDAEFKRGVDAARLTVALSDSQELEAILVAEGTALARGLYLGRWRASLGRRVDVSALAGSSYGRATLALDVSGDVGGVGWYAEASVRDEAQTPLWRALRATWGGSAQLDSGLMVTLEGHYSGPGHRVPYAQSLSSTALSRQAGEVFLLGRWYAALALGYAPGLLTQLGLAYIQNLTDGSGLLTTTLSYELAQEVTLGLGALLPVGRRPQADPGQVSGVRLRSELGAAPALLFTEVRLVF